MRICLFLLLATLPLWPQTKPRARDLGVPLEGTPGPLNAIVDVAGVTVGHRTLISGTSVRTGVTAVWPRGRKSSDPAFGGWFSQNGNGDMTGTHWLEESGFLDGPVLITNTHSVGVVRDAFLGWLVKNHRLPGTNTFAGGFYTYPIVAETYDGQLNDVNGFHVKPEDAWAALDGASTGPVPEGNVGGGTGMVCYGFKGGIGTSSRRLPANQGGYTVGVLVQCNCGSRRQLRIGGLPVGEEISQSMPVASLTYREDQPVREDVGSIIIVVATDAPMLPHQVKRLARRATLGLGRTGSISGNGSGDIFIAFSTANPGAAAAPAGANQAPMNVSMLPNDSLNPVFEATVQATEEAIVNAMVGAETMTGVAGHKVYALPHDKLREVLKKYNRLAK
ncbi:MAG TPA: P1 family peptidase [Candidatus Acidoferrales bacterium]|jgi:D-aminopeptidase|nr:P1 family peptidase [Candidatus Acidoferrales bacterium]